MIRPLSLVISLLMFLIVLLPQGVIAAETADDLITPGEVVFDINNPSDISITIKNGETLSDIKFGTVSLIKGVDYTITDNVVKITKGYYQYIFSKWPNGTCDLTFIMTSGKTALLKATGKVSQPLIAPNEVQYDMSSQDGVKITIGNGETLVDIKAIALLKKGVDYTVSGNVVTINGYFRYIFGKWPNGTCNLTFIMASGKTALLKATRKVPQEPLIAPNEVQYDMSSQDGVKITIGNGETLVDIKAIALLKKGVDYTVSGNVVTINGYFRYIFGKWPNGTCNLTFIMASGKTALLKVTKSLITPNEVQYDMSSQDGVKITIENGETLSDIKAVALLKKGVDYTVSGNVVTINGYFRYIFGKWPNGTCNLTFIMASGKTALLKATRKVPQEPLITPSKMQYDMSDPDDVKITIGNGETLVDIKAVALLKKGVDYTVSGNVVTINSYFRYILGKWPNGTCNLTFIMASGKTALLQATKKPVINNGIINPGSITFDINKPADVTLTVKDSESLSDIKDGDIVLKKGINYTVEGNTIKISKDYFLYNFTKRYDVNRTLTFVMTSGRTDMIEVASTIPILKPVIMPTDGIFNKMAPSYAIVNMMTGGYTLTSINDGAKTLIAGSDYTVNSRSVILSKEYLGQLVVGSHTITFNFAGDQPVSLSYNLIVENVPDTNAAQEVIFDRDNPKDQFVKFPYNNGTLVSITSSYYELQKNKDYIVKDNKVTLKSRYLANLDADTRLNFKYSTGNGSVVTVIIVGETFKGNLYATIGSSNTVRGTKIMIPVTLSKLPSEGIAGMSFTLQYDAKYIESIAVEAGHICEQPDKNIEVNYKDNKIIVEFIDDTVGSYLIKNEGALINLKIKLKDGVTGQTQITVSDPGIASDADFNTYEINWMEGNIIIN